MAQRMRKEEDLRIVKKRELLAAVFIIILAIIILNKYYSIIDQDNEYTAILRNNSSVENYIFNNSNSLIKSTGIESFSIVKKNNNWISRNENFSIDYNSKGDIILIIPENENEIIYTKIYELRDYSKGGIVQTNIPYFSEEKFKIYEQEDFIPIFGYHKVIPDSQPIKSRTTEIHQSKFREQITYATDIMECNWITMSELTGYLVNQTKTPRNACVITFDDSTTYEYDYALPILEEYGIKATFYAIVGEIGKEKHRMSWQELDKLFLLGHDIQSHTYNVTDGLISEDLTPEEMYFQLSEPKKILEERYHKPVETFAYPLGEWSNDVINLLSYLKYSIGRDTNKDNLWNPRRAVTVFDDRVTLSTDSTEGNNNSNQKNNGIWHMFYYKPEQKSIQEIGKDLMYNGWWQFEENYIIEKDENNNIGPLSGTKPTNTSYGVLRLMDDEDKINVPFIVSNDGEYTIEIFLSETDKDIDDISPGESFDVEIDNYKKSPIEDGDCQQANNWSFCSYYVNVKLEKGKHYLGVTSKDGIIKLDKFRMYRELRPNRYYRIEVEKTSYI